MNCEKGDLAVIVSMSAFYGDWPIGRIVRCLRLDDDGECWYIEPKLVGPDGRVWGTVWDGCLRPIRDPGDDAKDEMLRPLPQEVTA